MTTARYPECVELELGFWRVEQFAWPTVVLPVEPAPTFAKRMVGILLDEEAKRGIRENIPHLQVFGFGLV